MAEGVRAHSEVPEDKNAPCNLCGRGWPYHHDACAYKQTAIERDALAVRLNETEKALREIVAMHPVDSGLRGGDVARAALASAGGPTTEGTGE